MCSSVSPCFAVIWDNAPSLWRCLSRRRTLSQRLSDGPGLVHASKMRIDASETAHDVPKLHRPFRIRPVCTVGYRFCYRAPEIDLEDMELHVETPITKWKHDWMPEFQQCTRVPVEALFPFVLQFETKHAHPTILAFAAVDILNVPPYTLAVVHWIELRHLRCRESTIAVVRVEHLYPLVLIVSHPFVLAW